MKKSFIFFFFVIAGMSLTAWALDDDIKQAGSCKFCGMDREKFSHSRIFIEYEDGSSVGTCSLRCAAVELALSIDKAPKLIKVGDYNAKKLIDAEKAVWTVGGGKQGVMTKRPKWAFENKNDAEAFVKENGGTMQSFEETMRMAYEDLYEDTRMIRERRKMKRMSGQPVPQPPAEPKGQHTH